MEANYYLVQHIPNPFRREPKNVGLIVHKGADVAARFLGEIQPGTIDHRKIKGFESPGLYEQWIEYWRFELRAGMDGIKSISQNVQGHFRLCPPTEVESVNGDAAQDILSRLYPALVGERQGGAALRLQDTIAKAFESLKILSEDRGFAEVRHPVKQNVPVMGTRVPHRPSFIQEYKDDFYVMQAIDSHKPARARMIAGYAAHMYLDLAKSAPDRHVIPISIVRGIDHLNPEARREFIEVLSDASSRIVNWDYEPEQKGFLEHATDLAHAA